MKTYLGKVAVITAAMLAVSCSSSGGDGTNASDRITTVSAPALAFTTQATNAIGETVYVIDDPASLLLASSFDPEKLTLEPGLDQTRWYKITDTFVRTENLIDAAEMSEVTYRSEHYSQDTLVVGGEIIAVLAEEFIDYHDDDDNGRFERESESSVTYFTSVESWLWSVSYDDDLVRWVLKPAYPLVIDANQSWSAGSSSSNTEDEHNFEITSSSLRTEVKALSVTDPITEREGCVQMTVAGSSSRDRSYSFFEVIAGAIRPYHGGEHPGEPEPVLVVEKTEQTDTWTTSEYVLPGIGLVSRSEEYVEETEVSDNQARSSEIITRGERVEELVESSPLLEPVLLEPVLLEPVLEVTSNG